MLRKSPQYCTMKLYIAVTPDELELPLFVTDNAQVMACWAGIKVSSVFEMCSKNAKKPPYNRGKGGKVRPYRIRRINVEENEE